MGCPRPAAVLNHPLALPQGNRGIWPALTSSSICGYGEQEILDTGRVLDYGTIGVAHVDSVSRNACVWSCAPPAERRCAQRKKADSCDDLKCCFRQRTMCLTHILSARYQTLAGRRHVEKERELPPGGRPFYSLPIDFEERRGASNREGDIGHARVHILHSVAIIRQVFELKFEPAARRSDFGNTWRAEDRANDFPRVYFISGTHAHHCGEGHFESECAQVRGSRKRVTREGPLSHE